MDYATQTYGEEEYSETARIIWNIHGINTFQRGWETHTAKFMNDNFMSIAEHLAMTAKGY